MRITHALFATVAALALCGCPELFSVLQKPAVTCKRVDVTRVSPTGIGANFVLGVDNPNPIGLPVARLDYQLTVDGHALAEGRANQNMSIPGNGSADVTLSVSVQFAELGMAMQSAMTKESLPYTIRAKVAFDTVGGTLEIPIEQSGNFVLAGVFDGFNARPRW